MIKVPNSFPTTTSNKIAIIGEAPGRNEVDAGTPFVGPSGQLLRSILGRAGISSHETFFGNICQYQPPANVFDRLPKWQIEEGVEQLKLDLAKLQPNICFLLGNVPLRYALYGKTSVSNWRGTTFLGNIPNSPFYRVKCLPSYHPAAVLRSFSWAPILQFDAKKLCIEKNTPSLNHPFRSALVEPTFDQVMTLLNETRLRKEIVALDIEGGIGTMSCISFAPSANSSFIVPLAKLDGTSFWPDVDQETSIWRALSDLLTNPEVPKVLQNSLYDRFVLHYSYGIPVRGVVDDTMLKHWELYCELEKSLGFQSSLYTNEPYYKFERKSGDRVSFYNYCCKDSMVTYEINEKLTSHLSGRSLDHYRFNVDLLNPLLYMELRGIKYDEAGAKQRCEDLRRQQYAHQYRLDKLTSPLLDFSLPTTKEEFREFGANFMCYKKDRSVPKANHIQNWARLNAILAQPSYSEPDLGEMHILCNTALNVNSFKQFSNFLYKTLGLPIQVGVEKKPTTNYEALLKLSKLVKAGTLEEAVIKCAIEIRSLETHSQMLSIKADSDGRIRCGYNVVGTETGRVTCYTSPTGSGYNLQTIPSYDRNLFRADDGYYFFQCDLSGADGWTVAANLKALGDPTMFDDLLAGIKPAKVVALALRHGPSILTESRERLLELSKEVKKEDWDYFACKVVQHGTCYLMGPIVTSRNVFKLSEGKTQISVPQAKQLQSLFTSRYRVHRWHDSVSRRLGANPSITSASGHRRVFFGRKAEILGAALAHEPQNNTTYATNLAVSRLWNDPENRIGNKLIVEPLHQVHDALCGQFPINLAHHCISWIRRWFDNEITIAGIPVKIPFEGGYGPSWGELNQSI